MCTVEPAEHLGDALCSDCGLTGTHLGASTDHTQPTPCVAARGSGAGTPMPSGLSS